VLASLASTALIFAKCWLTWSCFIPSSSSELLTFPSNFSISRR
jgi:hypothetical protein